MASEGNKEGNEASQHSDAFEEEIATYTPNPEGAASSTASVSNPDPFSDDTTLFASASATSSTDPHKASSYTVFEAFGVRTPQKNWGKSEESFFEWPGKDLESRLVEAPQSLSLIEDTEEFFTAHGLPDGVDLFNEIHSPFIENVGSASKEHCSNETPLLESPFFADFDAFGGDFKGSSGVCEAAEEKAAEDPSVGLRKHSDINTHNAVMNSDLCQEADDLHSSGWEEDRLFLRKDEEYSPRGDLGGGRESHAFSWGEDEGGKKREEEGGGKGGKEEVKEEKTPENSCVFVGFPAPPDVFSPSEKMVEAIHPIAPPSIAEDQAGFSGEIEDDEDFFDDFAWTPPSMMVVAPPPSSSIEVFEGGYDKPENAVCAEDFQAEENPENSGKSIEFTQDFLEENFESSRIEISSYVEEACNILKQSFFLSEEAIEETLIEDDADGVFGGLSSTAIRHNTHYLMDSSDLARELDELTCVPSSTLSKSEESIKKEAFSKLEDLTDSSLLLNSQKNAHSTLETACSYDSSLSDLLSGFDASTYDRLHNALNAGFSAGIRNLVESRVGFVDVQRGWFSGLREALKCSGEPTSDLESSRSLRASSHLMKKQVFYSGGGLGDEVMDNYLMREVLDEEILFVDPENIDPLSQQSMLPELHALGSPSSAKEMLPQSFFSARSYQKTANRGGN